MYRESELGTRRSSDNQEAGKERFSASSPNGGLAEDALRKSEERLSSFMEPSPQASLTKSTTHWLR